MAFPSSVLSRRKKEPLDDFAQPVLGFQCGEKAGAGLGWRWFQDSPAIAGKGAQHITAGRTKRLSDDVS